MTLLTSSFYQNTPIKPRTEHDPDDSAKRECSRLIHAAIVNKRFREMLLANPIKSIETGYSGEYFRFSREEKERIKHIQARSLEEFALQLTQVVESPIVSEMAYIRRK